MQVARRGSAFKLEGIKALEANIRDLTAAVCLKKELSSGKKAAITQRAGRMVQEALWEAAEVVRKEAMARAMIQRWPTLVIGTMFAYAGLKSSRPPQSSSLIGMPKLKGPRAAEGKTWVYWKANNVGPRTRKGTGESIIVKVPKGGEVAMSLAAMYEFGTSRMEPRPALRPAVKSATNEVHGKLAEGYRKVIESFHWNE